MTKKTDLNEATRAVLDCTSERFDDIFKASGVDTSKHLRFANWSDVDFEDADIAGWDFTGARLNGANFSKVQNIDRAFFNRNPSEHTTTEFEGTILPDGVNVEMLMKQS